MNLKDLKPTTQEQRVMKKIKEKIWLDFVDQELNKGNITKKMAEKLKVAEFKETRRQDVIETIICFANMNYPQIKLLNLSFEKYIKELSKQIKRGLNAN